MPYSYKLALRAQTHFREATDWYYKENPNVAKDFVDHIEHSLNAICKTTNLYRQQYKHYSHFFLTKYPYTVIYTVNEVQQLVIIRAIYHQKRNPRNKYR